jgi:hypothetical protein
MSGKSKTTIYQSRVYPIEGPTSWLIVAIVVTSFKLAAQND